METPFSAGESAKELKDNTTPTGHLDWEVHVFRTCPASNHKKTKCQGLFAQEVMKMVKRPGGWSQKLWKRDTLEVLVFGLASD